MVGRRGGGGGSSSGGGSAPTSNADFVCATDGSKFSTMSFAEIHSALQSGQGASLFYVGNTRAISLGSCGSISPGVTIIKITAVTPNTITCVVDSYRGDTPYVSSECDTIYLPESDYYSYNGIDLERMPAVRWMNSTLINAFPAGLTAIMKPTEWCTFNSACYEYIDSNSYYIRVSTDVVSKHTSLLRFKSIGFLVSNYTNIDTSRIVVDGITYKCSRRVAEQMPVYPMFTIN